jgi:hypothetical protein
MQCTRKARCPRRTETNRADGLLSKAKKKTMSNVIIWNYVFHFSEYTNKWYAVHRDKYLDYWSCDKADFLSDENLDALIKKIRG